jgi:hypothetical protein
MKPMPYVQRVLLAGLCAGLALALASCTQEQQNKISRDIQNWTGTNGVLEVYAGDKLVRRFLKIDKLSTAMGTDDKKCISKSATTPPTTFSLKTRVKRRA